MLFVSPGAASVGVVGDASGPAEVLLRMASSDELTKEMVFLSLEGRERADAGGGEEVPIFPSEASARLFPAPSCCKPSKV